MLNQFSRTELLYGQNALKKLSAFRVAVFGVGGVGSYCVEALCRMGIGSLTLIDNDVFTLTNLNRQLHALFSTIGMAKVDVCQSRIKDINPDCKVEVKKLFYSPAVSSEIDLNAFDYVVDAIDTVTAKLELIKKAQENNIKIISCMGTGNKLDPTALEITDIFKTSVCPLAKVMRHELKKLGIKSQKVLYSREKPLQAENHTDYSENTSRRQTPGSNSFVPATAGLILAYEVIKDLLS